MQLARQRQARLLVVSSLGLRAPTRSLLGSVAERTAESSPVPMLVVRDAAPIAGPRIRECRRVLAAVDLGASHGFAAPYAYSIANPGGMVRLMHVVEPFRLTNPLIGRHYQDRRSDFMRLSSIRGPALKHLG